MYIRTYVPSIHRTNIDGDRLSLEIFKQTQIKIERVRTSSFPTYGQIKSILTMFGVTMFYAAVTASDFDPPAYSSLWPLAFNIKRNLHACMHARTHVCWAGPVVVMVGGQINKRNN